MWDWEGLGEVENERIREMVDGGSSVRLVRGSEK